jgi:molybdopterin-guanine dinucleotide biosynthesis protein B
MKSEEFNMARLIGFSGKSNSGKTTLIEKLIPLLRAYGYQVNTVKHTHHEVNVDQPGKDSFRHKSAGASATLLASPGKIAFMSDCKDPVELEGLIEKFFQPDDVVLVEGFKRYSFPQIFFHDAESFNVKSDMGNIVALISEIEPNLDLPCFKRDDVPGIFAFILNRLKQSEKRA